MMLPILLPTAQEVGVDPLHLGIILIANSVMLLNSCCGVTDLRVVGFFCSQERDEWICILF